VVVPALSLSSFRTLLVALPNEQYAMVKVSLDEKIGGAVRLLQHKPSKIAYLVENFSFVHPYKSCIEFEWFKELIFKTYLH